MISYELSPSHHRSADMKLVSAHYSFCLQYLSITHIDDSVKSFASGYPHRRNICRKFYGICAACRKKEEAGGIPASLLSAGTKKEVEDCVKQLVEDAGKNGGFMASVTASIEQAAPDNLHVLMDAVKKYGTY